MGSCSHEFSNLPHLGLLLLMEVPFGQRLWVRPRSQSYGQNWPKALGFWQILPILGAAVKLYQPDPFWNFWTPFISKLLPAALTLLLEGDHIDIIGEDFIKLPFGKNYVLTQTSSSSRKDRKDSDFTSIACLPCCPFISDFSSSLPLETLEPATTASMKRMHLMGTSCICCSTVAKGRITGEQYTLSLNVFGSKMIDTIIYCIFHVYVIMQLL